MSEKELKDRFLTHTVFVKSDETLRDDFAMAAMQGMLANNDSLEWANTALDGSNKVLDVFSEWAYAAADAMLIAREKKDE